MRPIVHKHRQGQPGNFLVITFFAAVLLFALMFLRNCSRELANWQTGHW